MKKVLAIFSLGVVLGSCNYQSTSVCVDGKSVIKTSIPVIKKDSNGLLRNYLAREMSFTNSFYYDQRSPKYELKVSITEDKNSKITFMWDRDPRTNERLDVFYPTEGSKEIVAKVELIDIATCKAVIKPFFISTSGDYDFVNPTVRTAVEFPLNGVTTSVLQYSLGQLDAEEGAIDASYYPIYEDLAKKIVKRLMRTRKFDHAAS